MNIICLSVSRRWESNRTNALREHIWALYFGCNMPSVVPVAPGCPFRLSILSAAVEATFQGSLVVSSAIAAGRLYGIRLCPDACRQ